MEQVHFLKGFGVGAKAYYVQYLLNRGVLALGSWLGSTGLPVVYILGQNVAVLALGPGPTCHFLDNKIF